MVPLGSEIARVTAPDGGGAGIRYRSSPGVPQLFVVPRTGQILVVGSLLGVAALELSVYGQGRGRPGGLSQPLRLRLSVGDRGAGLSQGGRGARSAPEQLYYSVSVSENDKVGNAIYTIPDWKFQRRWFEVIAPLDAPVHIERDSGKVYLSKRIRAKSTIQITVKVNNQKELYIRMYVTELYIRMYVTELYIPMYVTELYIPMYTTEPYIPMYTTEPYIPMYTTEPYTPMYITEPYTPMYITEPYTPMYITELYIPMYTTELYIPMYVTELYIPMYVTELYIPMYVTELYIPMYVRELYIPMYITEPYIPMYITELCILMYVSELCIPMYIRELYIMAGTVVSIAA
ncbi:hypothetical protein scyTo_0015759 [Scyliorhinus torazame]|uniref:Uncharacterized protein n=1 Tax=Scyliorhinus torazame TaxID=75743 RepID=A0A401PYC0_SCYTO|nr:hypothetical protein [Scyliorhinus torazame]